MKIGKIQGGESGKTLAVIAIQATDQGVSLITANAPDLTPEEQRQIAAGLVEAAQILRNSADNRGVERMKAGPSVPSLFRLQTP